MPPRTEYIRHASRLARKLQMAAELGEPAQPDKDFWKTLWKALDEMAEGLEAGGKRGEN
ncbi:MAG TPA: hypothetical protein VJ773_00940 [Gemmatimonadales bacterium]|nr:hypothetical protein [Gemmatimonadales bacterium]